VLLPAGAAIDDPRIASQPRGAMLRIDAEGRVPDAGPLHGITAHPLGFGWYGPAGSPLFGLVAGTPGQVEVRALGDTSAPGLASYPLLMASLDPRSGFVTPAPPSSGVLGLLQRFAVAHDSGAGATFRLAAPVRVDGWVAGLSATVHDVTSGPGGTHFLVMRDEGTEPASAEGAALLVRIRPTD
jgi:hypothetical protein